MKIVKKIAAAFSLALLISPPAFTQGAAVDGDTQTAATQNSAGSGDADTTVDIDGTPQIEINYLIDINYQKDTNAQNNSNSQIDSNYQKDTDYLFNTDTQIDSNSQINSELQININLPDESDIINNTNYQKDTKYQNYTDTQIEDDAQAAAPDGDAQTATAQSENNPQPENAQTAAVGDDAQSESVDMFPKFTKADARHVALAVVEASAFNVLLTSFNRVIREADYSMINLSDMRENLTHPWVWDQDEFYINQFGHPYQGAMYHTMGRANGMNFWQSFALAFYGSLTWEYLMENETPSYNDIIITPAAGSFFGEMLHRIYVDLDDKMPFISWAASPFGALNRLITGQKSPRLDGKIEEFSFYAYASHTRSDIAFGGGGRPAFFKEGVKSHDGYRSVIAGGVGMNIVYGDAFGHSTKEPLDQFTLYADFDFDGANYLLRIFADGFLFSCEVGFNSDRETTLGLGVAYDYIFSPDLNYQNNSLGFSVRERAHLPRKWTLAWGADAHTTYLSGVDNYYLLKDNMRGSTKDDSEQRLYDLGIGGVTKAQFSISNERVGAFKTKAAAAVFYTLPPTVQDDGSNGFNVVWYAEAFYEHRVWKRLFAGASVFLYGKYSFYMHETFADTRQFMQNYKIFMHVYL